MKTENIQETKPETGNAKIPVQRLVMCDAAIDKTCQDDRCNHFSLHQEGYTCPINFCFTLDGERKCLDVSK